MTVMAGLLVLVAVALLVGGLAAGATGLLWASVVASGLAAAVLVVQTVRRHREAVARTAELADAAIDGPAVPDPAAAGSAGPAREATAPTGAVGGVDPAEEEVEVADLLLVLDLTDEVVVVDEHPRYHLAGCAGTAGREEIALPLTEAREDGFTACGVCRPDRHLAGIERTRRAAATE